MLLEGIRSERRLIEQASLQLAWRWYLGYDLDEPSQEEGGVDGPDGKTFAGRRGRPEAKVGVRV